MSIDIIDRYISELEAINNYEQIKKERDEALQKADPIQMVQRIITELSKKESEQQFPKELVECGLVKKVDELITNRVNQRVDAHRWWHENIESKKYKTD